MIESRSNRLLSFSLVFNVLALAAAGYVLYRHGTWANLRDHFGAPKALNKTLNSDEVAYLTRETLFQQLPARESPIVFLGDSQTEDCEWDEIFSGAINRGIGGDTSAGLLKRVSAVTRLKPRAVFLLIGANDFARGIEPQETAANIRSTVWKIRESSPDTFIFVEGLLPTGWMTRNVFAMRVNQLLRSLSNGKTILYLDFYDALREGDLLKANYSFDGLHLNGDGLMAWKKLLDPYVAPFLPPRKTLSRFSGAPGLPGLTNTTRKAGRISL
jgi:lysophospholipase L1-like esterase